MPRSVVRPTFYVAVAAIGSGVFGLYVLVAASVAVEPSESVVRLWSWLYAVLLAGWIVSDSFKRQNIYRPFDFGFLVVIFGLAYAPYYFLKTRGAKGILWIVGATGLFYLGMLAAVALSVSS